MLKYKEPSKNKTATAVASSRVFLFCCCSRIILSVCFIHSSFAVLYTYVYEVMKKAVGDMMGPGRTIVVTVAPLKSSVCPGAVLGNTLLQKRERKKGTVLKKQHYMRQTPGLPVRTLQSFASLLDTQILMDASLNLTSIPKETGTCHSVIGRHLWFYLKG